MADKRYTRDKLGVPQGMDDRLIKGAYISARAQAPDYGWMNLIGGGIQSFKAEVDAQNTLKKTERDGQLSKIGAIVDNIYETGGGLDEVYFNQAYDYTEDLREQYIAALDAGDTKMQHQIKGKLNLFSTSIQTLKTDLTESAGLWNDKALVNTDGMTQLQLDINSSLKSSQVMLGEDGVYKWRNEKHNPTDPNSKEFFTQEDLKNALPLKDEENKKNYLDFNKKIIDAGENYRDGDGIDFDFQSQHKNNIALLENSVSSTGSMQSMIWDDITGQGSFVQSLDQHPDFSNVFDAINNKDGLPNVAAISMFDKTGDGVVDFRDFIDFDSPESRVFYSEEFQKDDDPAISEKELELIMGNEQASKAMLDIAKEKLRDAITKTDHPNYNQELTQNLVADFLTNRQKQMFYGQDGDKYLEIIPKMNEDGTFATEGNVTYNENKGILKIGKSEIHSLDMLKQNGGSYGYLKSKGFTYDDKNDRWIYNEAFAGGTYTPVPTADDIAT